MIKDNFVIARLIVRWILGDKEHEEKEILKSWRQNSPENELLYEELTDPEKIANAQWMMKNLDEDRGWADFLQRRERKQRRSLFITWGRYAAVVLVLVTLTFWVVNRYQGEIVSPSGESMDNYQIRLTLADGREVALNEYTGLIHAGKENAIITNDKGEITYTDTTTIRHDEMVYNELYIPRGAEYLLRLSEGTVIMLNSDTRIRYPVRFSGDIREVEMVGEGYFNVKPKAEHPFIVKTGHYDVVVLGTEFTVTNYADDPEHRTILVEGSVKIKEALNGKEHILRPDEGFFIQTSTDNSRVEAVNPYYFTGWVEGKYRFYEEPLEKIMKTVERWYNLEVIYLDESLRKLEFTLFAERHDSVEHLVKIFEQNDKISIQQEGKTLKIGRRN